jgi:uracil-DNA glycosylase
MLTGRSWISKFFPVGYSCKIRADMSHLRMIGRRVIECRLCPRLVVHRETIGRDKRRQYREWTYWAKPVPGFGDPDAHLFVLGLAPAAHGGNRTGRIFTGDRSGDWLYEALYRYGFANQPQSIDRDDGLVLTDCYVAAVVRCAPPDNKPLPEEFKNCRPYLIEELRALRKVSVVVALGKVAFDEYLKACEELDPGRFRPLRPGLRFGHGAVYHLPSNVTLLGSYHPSQQNTFTGKLTRPMFHAVFRQAKRLLESHDITSQRLHLGGR